MCVAIKQPGIVPIEAPLLAAVQRQQGTSYVPRARDYQGFLVQRRYRGIGEAKQWQTAARPGQFGGQMWEEYERFVPYWHAVLNPSAVKAAGLIYAEVAAWVQEHGEAVFMHPTYAPLCLRWGQNSDGSLVSAVESAVLDEGQEAICFTARTNLLTGKEIYHLETPLEEGPLLTDLQQTAGLALRLWRDRERWKGYFTHNLAAAQQVVAAHGYTWVWAQRYSVYEVVVYQPVDGKLVPQHWRFATPEEARTWYEQLPSAPRPADDELQMHPSALMQNGELLLGEEFNGSITAEKFLASNWQAVPLTLSADQVAVTRVNSIPCKDLTNNDAPLYEPVPTLASLLDEQQLSGTEVAARLGLTLPTLQRRLHNPMQWTVAELQRVAQLINWPIHSVLTLLPV